MCLILFETLVELVKLLMDVPHTSLKSQSRILRPYNHFNLLKNFKMVRTPEAIKNTEEIKIPQVSQVRGESVILEMSGALEQVHLCAAQHSCARVNSRAVPHVQPYHDRIPCSQYKYLKSRNGKHSPLFTGLVESALSALQNNHFEKQHMVKRVLRC